MNKCFEIESMVDGHLVGSLSLFQDKNWKVTPRNDVSLFAQSDNFRRPQLSIA